MAVVWQMNARMSARVHASVRVVGTYDVVSIAVELELEAIDGEGDGEKVDCVACPCEPAEWIVYDGGRCGCRPRKRRRRGQYAIGQAGARRGGV